jgi:hypothetical protein
VIFIPEQENAAGAACHGLSQIIPRFPHWQISLREIYWINPSLYAAGLTHSCLDLLSNGELLELPNGVPKDIALDYARTHYLSILKEGLVGHCLLGFT